jgi:hypothetical protein
MSPTRSRDDLARHLVKPPDDNKIRAPPPFSCICTPRYYYDRYLLNRPDFGLF